MCDVLVVIGDDGVLFAKNSDRDPNEAQLLEHHPAAEHAPGELSCTWSSLAQHPRTHGVLLSRPWWMWGAETGANEHGVVIGNEAVFTRRVGRRDGALLGMDLLRLALERSTDRHEAVQTIVSLHEEHGQGGSCSHEHPRFTYDNSFLVADPEGAVVLETAGRHWAAEEVVAGARSISNGLTIPGFADRFADPLRGRVAQCHARRARTEASGRSARRVDDMVAALRDHGGDAPAYHLTNGALSAPCAHPGGLLTATQTTASWVADLRAGLHWVTGTSAPCTSVFKPVRVEPLPYAAPPGSTNRYDPAQPWWRHERLHRSWMRDPGRYARAADERDALEKEFFAQEPQPTDAWAAASDWEDRWTPTGDPGGADARPAWVRRMWRRWDREAGVWR